jgi:hypothetical protein
VTHDQPGVVDYVSFLIHDAIDTSSMIGIVFQS